MRALPGLEAKVFTGIAKPEESIPCAKGNEKCRTFNVI